MAVAEDAAAAHENPHTGLRYVDDPALAIVEVHNEDCVFWHAPLNDLDAGEHQVSQARRRSSSGCGWSGCRNGTADDDALRAAWGPGMRGGDSLQQSRAWASTAPGRWRPTARRATRRRSGGMGDFIRFLAETQRAYYQRRHEQLRELGFQRRDRVHRLAGRRARRRSGQPLVRRRHGLHHPAQLLRRRGRRPRHQAGPGGERQPPGPARLAPAGHRLLPGRRQAADRDRMDPAAAQPVEGRGGAADGLLRHGPAGLGRLATSSPAAGRGSAAAGPT